MSRTERLFRLTQMLARSRCWRVAELASRLEVTRRTVYRDLDALSACGIPVYSDGKGYRLLQGAGLPALPLTATERAVLILALGNPAIERQASLVPSLRALQDKLRAGSRVLEEQPQALRLASLDRSGTAGPGVLEALEAAIRRQVSVRIAYRSLSGGQERSRTLDPYEVFHRSEAWYVVGWCHIHAEPRTFRLDRISRARLLPAKFDRPADFDLGRYLSDSWGVYRGRERIEAVVCFDPALGPLIENARHHPGERKRRLPSGQIEYRVRVSHPDEIARWVLGFEGKARAVQPPELVDRVREMAAAVLTVHRVAARKRSVAEPRARTLGAESEET